MKDKKITAKEQSNSNPVKKLGDEWGEFPDEQYMALLQNGDFSVLRILIARYQQYVLNRFRSIGCYSDEAEEMTHEIFIRVLEKRLTYLSDRSSFKTWLTTIVINLGRDHFKRKSKARRIVSTNNFEEICDEPSLPKQYSEQQYDLLETAMNRLSPDELTLIYLSRYRELPYAKIASMLKLSVANVKVKMHRTVARLRTLYIELGECA